MSSLRVVRAKAGGVTLEAEVPESWRQLGAGALRLWQALPPGERRRTDLIYTRLAMRARTAAEAETTYLQARAYERFLDLGARQAWATAYEGDALDVIRAMLTDAARRYGVVPAARVPADGTPAKWTAGKGTPWRTAA